MTAVRFTGTDRQIFRIAVPALFALVSEPLSASLARQHNDANVLAMGGRLVGPEMARPNDSSRPELPRGLHQSTAYPARACICTSSKNRLAYWVNGPPCTLSRSG